MPDTPLIVADDEPCSMREPDAWVTLGRTSPGRASGLGVALEKVSDSVTVRLADGSEVYVFGDGEVWYKGGNRLNITEDALPWQ